MDKDEIFITIESKLNKLLYNSDINYIEFYTYLYNISIKIQKIKSKTIRIDVIDFYYAIYNKIKESINCYLVNIYDKIIENKCILQTYSIELNIFNSNLETINNLTEYFNNQLIKMDPFYIKLDFVVYGMNKWYENIIFKLLPFINIEIKKCLTFGYEEGFGDSYIDYEDELYYINELLEHIYYCISNNIIDSTIFDINIGNEINKYLIKIVVEHSTLIKDNPNFLIFINNFNTFYKKQLSLLNLETLQPKYKQLFNEKIVNKYEYIIKKTLNTLLYSIKIDKFKLYYSFEKYTIINLTYCLNYCYDIEFIDLSLIKWIDSYCVNSFASILDLIYLLNLLYIKLQETDQTTKLENIYKCTLYLYKKYLPNDKNIIEKYDKYIRDYLYKDNNIPLELFYNSISLYFSNYIEEELLFVYYKVFLIKRLNRYNFNSKYIEIEIDIIDILVNKLNISNLYKINIIKKDLIASKYYSNEFNIIYNRQSKLIITTDGIWNIKPKTYIFSNMYFNNIFNKFILDFSHFYNCKYQNKKIDWNYDISSCIINYNISVDKSIEINCPLKYGNILYEFNDIDTYIPSNKGITKYCNEMVKYGLLKINNGEYILNNDIKYKNITIKHVSNKLKKIKKSQKIELVFSKLELVELFIIRHVKAVNIMSETKLINDIQQKYDIDISLIHKILDRVVDNLYLIKEQNNYLYLI